MSGVLFPVQFHLVDMSQFLISGYIPTQLFYSRGYIPTQLFYSQFLVLIFPTWLVWNIAFIFPFSWKWKNHPIWRSHIFQRGRAQPPTSDCYPSYPIIIHIKPYKTIFFRGGGTPPTSQLWVLFAMYPVKPWQASIAKATSVCLPWPATLVCRAAQV